MDGKQVVTQDKRSSTFNFQIYVIVIQFYSREKYHSLENSFYSNVPYSPIQPKFSDFCYTTPDMGIYIAPRHVNHFVFHVKLQTTWEIISRSMLFCY